MGPDKRVKLQLSQVFTRGARSDSNSRPVVRISSPLTFRYAFLKTLIRTISHSHRDESVPKCRNGRHHEQRRDVVLCNE